MVQGRGIDASLNPKGQRQAALFFQKYQDTDFDKIYTSSLRRTRESVAGFIRKGISVETLEGLDEISWGSQEGKEFDEVSSQLYHATVTKWVSGNLDANVGGGESPNEVMKRQKIAMKHIMGQSDEQLILICMHGRAMRILLSWLLGYELTLMDNFSHDNLGLYELTFTGSMFRLDRYNDVSHLAGLTPD